MKYYFDSEERFVLEALSGKAKGSKIMLTLTDRGGSTGVKMDLMINVGIVESILLSFVSDNEIQSGMDSALYNYEQYVKAKYSQSKNPTEDVVEKQKSTSQIKSEKKVSSKELGTVKKTDLKKEAAQKLDLKKEAEKKLKQKDTGYARISEKQKSDLEKQIQTSKKKIEKTTKESSGYTGVSEKGKTDLEEQLELAKRKIEKASKTAIPLITLTTDKSVYRQNDRIIISGSVWSVQEGTPLTIQITNPDKIIVQIAQIDVTQDGKYATTVNVIGSSWNKGGTYTVKVQYGPPNVIVETNFEFITPEIIRPHITLDPLPSSVSTGDIVTFSGKLYLSEIPQDTIVYIKDEDPLDSDDLLASAYVQSNGRFSVNWIATNVDTDRVADIYVVFEGFYPYYPRLATCDSSCTNTVKLRIN